MPVRFASLNRSVYLCVHGLTRVLGSTVAQANAIESARRQQAALAAQRSAAGQTQVSTGAVAFVQSPNRFHHTPAHQHRGRIIGGVASEATPAIGVIDPTATSGATMNAPASVGKTANRTSKQQSSPTAFRKCVYLSRLDTATTVRSDITMRFAGTSPVCPGQSQLLSRFVRCHALQSCSNHSRWCVWLLLTVSATAALTCRTCVQIPVLGLRTGRSHRRTVSRNVSTEVDTECIDMNS